MLVCIGLTRASGIPRDEIPPTKAYSVIVNHEASFYTRIFPRLESGTSCSSTVFVYFRCQKTRPGTDHDGRQQYPITFIIATPHQAVAYVEIP